jgi:hypothetical protein
MADMLGTIAFGAVPGEQEVRLVVVGPQPDPGMWPAIAAAILLLAAAALLAHRRATRPDARPAGRIGRILWSSLACAGGLSFVMAPGEIVGNLFQTIPNVIAAFAIKLLGWTILAALLFGSADLMLDALRPRRTLAWLSIGPPLLTLYGVGFLAASEWLDGFDPGPAGPAPLAAVLAAALVWWSLLPVAADPESRGVAAIFE